MPMSSPANPYIAGPPVTDPDHFFGREDIIREVEQTLRSATRNWVILHGQRRIGKTSLLLQLEQRLPDPPFFTVYFDLAGKEFTPVGQVLHQMATAAAEKAGIPGPSLADFQDEPEAFHQTFLPVLYQSLGSERQVVFLLDEFNLLTVSEKELAEDTAIRGLNRYLYNLLTSQGYTDFVFTAGRRMEELSAVTGSRFKPDLERFISVLNPEQTRDLILQNGSKNLPTYDEAAVERIQTITHGHPYLTQLLCQALFEQAASRSRRKPQVTVQDVEVVIPTLLASNKNDLPLVWESMPLPERLTLAAMAAKGGEGEAVNQTVIAETLQQAGISPKMKGLSQATENLVNWQILEQSGGDYHFFVEFMRRWTAQERPLERVKREELRPTPAGQGYSTGTRPVPDKNRSWLWPAAIVALLLLAILVYLLGGYNLIRGTDEAATATVIAKTLFTPTPTVANINQANQEETATPVIEPTTEATVEATPTSTPEIPATEEIESPPQEQPTPSQPQLSGQIRLAGSSDMQPLIEALMLAFTAQRPDVQIVIQGTDSQAGLEAVRQGVADAGLIAREVAASELADLQLHPLVEKDVIALIVHPLVQFDSLTTEQVRDIFSGAITSWADLGGANAPIRVVARAEGSDTQAIFEQIIIGQEGLITASAIQESSGQIVRSIVASRPYTIGFISLDEVQIDPTFLSDGPNWAVLDTTLLDVKLLALDGIAPSLENARNDLYLLTRPLNIVTQNQPNELVQEWLDFIMSPAGQQIIDETGHIPAPR